MGRPGEAAKRILKLVDFDVGAKARQVQRVGVRMKDQIDALVPTHLHIALEWDTERDGREFASAYSALINKIAPGQAGTGTPTCWSLPGEYGYFNWEAGSHRADIVVSNDESALKAALSGALSTSFRPCGSGGTAEPPAATAVSAQPDAATVAAPNAARCVLARSGGDVDLVGVGDFPAAMLDRLRETSRAEYGIRVNVLPPLAVGDDAIDARREQLVGETLLTEIEGQAARLQRGDVVIGITADDMMPRDRPDWAFALSNRDASAGAAVISITRMDPANTGPGPDDELLFARAEKMVAKNIGVLYLNRAPVSDPHSVMYGNVLSVSDLDVMGDDLCRA